MKTSNPALNERVFRGLPGALGETMTMNGTVHKTGILLLCSVVTAVYAWHTFTQTQDPASIMPFLWIGTIGGFVLAMVTVFKKAWSPVTAPLYALLEGLALGSISVVLNMRFPGLAIQAVCLTFGVLLVMLTAYSTGMVRATRKFQLGVIAATGAIMLFYVLEMVLGFFKIHFVALNGSSPLGIGFSVVIVIIAALNLVLDFNMIETGVRMGAPKYMEWYGAFGIMVTLVWLYLEILRLLSKVRGRD
jgi:uncharacterized YccA/Bax inhibitor family protein